MLQYHVITFTKFLKKFDWFLWYRLSW